MKQSKAFIIVFALMIVSLMVYLTQQLVNGVFVTGNFVSIVVQREQAKMIALSGVQIAINQLLSLEIEEKDKDKKKEGMDAHVAAGEESKQQEAQARLKVHDKKFLDQILPFLNRWRTFSFDEKQDGFAAELRICLTCEEGKINLNEAFDFKKLEFKKEYAALLKSLEIKDKLAAGELAAKLQDFLAKRQRKLEDISELMQLPVCKNLDIFYKPPEKSAQKKEEAQPNINLALSDIFTLWTESYEINPLLFSDGLCAMFTFRRPLATDPELLKKKFKEFKSQFKLEIARDWDAHWETLKILYEQKPVFFKEMQGIFSKEFGPRTYSVISYATVGKVTQRVIALVKKINRPHAYDKQKDEKVPTQQAASEENEAKSIRSKYDYKILRLYWL